MKKKWLGLIDKYSVNVVASKKELSHKDHVFRIPKFLKMSFHELVLNLVSFPLYFKKTYKIDPTLFNKEGFSYQLYRKRRKTSIALTSLTAFSYLAFTLAVSYGLVGNVSLAYASGSTWTQTDWSSGVGTNTSNQYQSATTAYTTTTGQFEAATTTGWYDTAWLYRRKITIDSTQVSSTQSNFPVLVTEDNFDSHFFSNVNTNGTDLVFTSSDGTTVLNREVVSVSTTASTMQAWVNVPSVSSAADTDIYVYYGNASANVSNNASTWSSAYAAVWHFEEDPSISTDGSCSGAGFEVCDSANSNHGNATNANFSSSHSVSGQLGNAIQFVENPSSAGRVLDVATDSTIDDLTDMSVSFWIKGDATPGSDQYGGRLITKYLGSCNSGGWEIQYDDTGDVYLAWDSQPATANPVFMWGREYTTSDAEAVNSDTDFTPKTSWHHVVFTYANSLGATDSKFYIDGVAVSSYLKRDTAAGSLIGDAGCDIRIGAHPNDTVRQFDGTLDEIRLAPSTLSATYIETEYNNQSDPANFYSVGSVESRVNSSATLTSAIFDTTEAETWGTLTYTATGNSASTTVKVRTDNSSDMSGATDFASCTAVASGDDISANGCVTDGHRYIQYQAALTTDGITTSSPVFQDVAIVYYPPVEEDAVVSAESDSVSVSGGAVSRGSSVQYSIGENGVAMSAVTINGGEEKTNSRKVLLSFAIDNAEEIMISEDITFQNAFVFPYQDSLPWVLSEGIGDKVIYVRFKLFSGIYYDEEVSIELTEQEIENIEDLSEILRKSDNTARTSSLYEEDSIFDSIIVGIKSIFPFFETRDLDGGNTNNEVCPLEADKPYAAALPGQIYLITENCTKRLVENEDLFFTHFSSLGDVVIEAQEILDQIPEDPAGPVLPGKNYVPREGEIVRFPESSYSYIFEDSSWRKFNTDYTFSKLGYEYDDLIYLDQTLFDKYPGGEDYTEADIGPFKKDLNFQDEDQDVSELKKVLHEMEYFYLYETTPFFGTTLEEALERFQKDNDLPVTKTLDKDTRKELNILLNE